MKEYNHSMTEIRETAETSEVPFNKALIDALRSVNDALREVNGNSPLVNEGRAIKVINNGTALVNVTLSDILIAGESFQDRVVTSSTSSEMTNLSQRLGTFLTGISGKLIRLNHVGVSYFADDIEQESTGIQRLAENSGIPLYEETSTDPKEKWYFLDNTDNWEEPLAEIVLNSRDEDLDFWKPHFQIDIDTTLTLEQIRELTDQYLGKDFINWQLDIPDYGTVLTLGVLGEIGGTKIVLGIGTNIRGTEYHRRHVLIPLS